MYRKDGGTIFTPHYYIDFGSNVWYHIAVVRNGDVVKVACNGIFDEVNKITGQSGFDFSFDAPLNIGRRLRWDDNGEWRYFYSYIYELRISKGIARWTSNFTPPSEPYSYVPMYRKLSKDGVLSKDVVGGQVKDIFGTDNI